MLGDGLQGTANICEMNSRMTYVDGELKLLKNPGILFIPITSHVLRASYNGNLPAQLGRDPFLTHAGTWL